MKTVQGTTLVSLHAVDGFIESNAAALGSIVTSGARQKLAALIAVAATHTAAQTGSELESLGATIGNQGLRTALMRDHMAPIASIARSELPQTPAIAPLRLPRGRPSNPRLVMAAEGMAKAAEPFADIFVTSGLPADFITRLNTAAEALLTSLGDHSNIRSRRKVATTGIQSTLSEGRKVVRVLDTYVKSALKDDPILLSGWNSVKRVRRVGQRVVVAVPTTPAPTLAPVKTNTTAS